MTDDAAQNAVKALCEIKKTQKGDKEAAHIEADKILLRFLCDAGFEEVAKAWLQADEDSGGFWYA